MPAESVAEQAVTDLLRNIDAGGCVDEYLQDQVGFFSLSQTIEKFWDGYKRNGVRCNREDCPIRRLSVSLRIIRVRGVNRKPVRSLFKF